MKKNPSGAATGKPIRALLVAQSRSLKTTLEDMADRCPGVDPIGAVETHADALRVFRKQRPRLVVIEMFLAGDESGLELALVLKSRSRPPRVIVITPHGGKAVALAVEQSEADGFVAQDSLANDLPRLVQAIFPRLRKQEGEICLT